MNSPRQAVAFGTTSSHDKLLPAELREVPSGAPAWALDIMHRADLLPQDNESIDSAIARCATRRSVVVSLDHDVAPQDSGRKLRLALRVALMEIAEDANHAERDREVAALGSVAFADFEGEAAFYSQVAWAAETMHGTTEAWRGQFRKIRNMHALREGRPLPSERVGLCAAIERTLANAQRDLVDTPAVDREAPAQVPQPPLPLAKAVAPCSRAPGVSAVQTVSPLEGKATSAQWYFYRSGEDGDWAVGDEGKMTHPPHRVGFIYVHALLSEPQVSFEYGRLEPIPIGPVLPIPPCSTSIE